jgi:hypothetical protein
MSIVFGFTANKLLRFSKEPKQISHLFSFYPSLRAGTDSTGTEEIDPTIKTSTLKDAYERHFSDPFR